MKPNPVSLGVIAGISFLISSWGQSSPARATLLKRAKMVPHVSGGDVRFSIFLLTQRAEVGFESKFKSVNRSPLLLSLRNPSTSRISSSQQVITLLWFCRSLLGKIRTRHSAKLKPESQQHGNNQVTTSKITKLHSLLKSLSLSNQHLSKYVAKHGESHA